MSWISQHKLVFILVVAVVAIGVWYGLSQSGAPAPLLTTSAVDVSPSEQSTDQEIIGTLLALRSVTLSGSIFSDPAFVSLQDFGTTIIPEPVGRQNPFAPLSSQNASYGTSGASQGTQLFTPLTQ